MQRLRGCFKMFGWWKEKVLDMYVSSAYARYINTREKKLAVLGGNNTENMCSAEIDKFRAGFFSSLYGINISRESRFIRSVTGYESAVLSVILPTTEEIYLGGEELTEFFTTKAEKFSRIIGDLSLIWLFDASRDNDYFENKSENVRNVLEELVGQVSLVYERILIDANIRQGLDDCLACCLPHFFKPVKEIETNIEKVKVAHLERVARELEGIQSQFEGVVAVYQTNILPQKMIRGVRVEKPAVNERSPLLIHNPVFEGIK